MQFLNFKMIGNFLEIIKCKEYNKTQENKQWLFTKF